MLHTADHAILHSTSIANIWLQRRKRVITKIGEKLPDMDYAS